MTLRHAAVLLAFFVTPAFAQITAPVGSVKPTQDANGAYKSAPRGPVTAPAAAVLACNKTGYDHATLTNTSSIDIVKGSLIEISTVGKTPPYGSSLGKINVYPGIPPGGVFEMPNSFNPEFVTCTAKVLK